MAQKVLITGGSGLVGKKLTQLLINKGFEVVWLSRKAGMTDGVQTFSWDLSKKTIDEKAFENINYIIHLAGSGIADENWTESRKKDIIDSRVDGTKLIYEYVKKLNVKLDAFITSSAVGFYGGDTGNELKDEVSTSGKDFLAQVCIAWENAALPFEELGIRTVYIRIGIVMAAEGGALPKLALPIKFGVGCYLSDGNQWMSWIHISDLCEIFSKGIEDNQMKGIYNAVAPNPVTNKVFTKILAKQLGRWVLPLYAPSFLFKIIFGEMAVVITGSSHVLCKRLSETDFTFQFRTLESALKDIFPSK